MDTGPVRGSRPQHWVPSQCWDRSPALQPPAIIRVVSSLSHEPQGGHKPRPSHPMPQHSPDPTCVGTKHHAGLPWHWVGCPDVRPVASPLLGLPSCCTCLGFLQPPGPARHSTAHCPHCHTCPRHWALHGTGHGAPGTGTGVLMVSAQHQAQTRVWHLAQPHIHGHRRVPGAASRGTAGALGLATLPRHGPASRCGQGSSGSGRFVPPRSPS